jgi:hypothetical protein
MEKLIADRIVLSDFVLTSDIARPLAWQELFFPKKNTHHVADI